MKIRQFLALALIGLVLGSCRKPDAGDGPDGVEPEGKLVKAKLAISIPKSIRTYAPGDGDLYATPEEVYADYIDVFVYENGGAYAVDHFHFVRTGPTPADFISAGDPNEGEFKNPGNGSTFVTGEFEVKEGDKLVYVGINLPDLIVHRLRTGYYVNEIFEEEDLLAELLSGTPGPGGSSNLAYFSSNRDVNVRFDAVTTANPIATTISVSRLVAKVVVTTPGGPATTAFDDVSGGTITDFEFAIGQRNNQMFVAPLLGTPGEDPNYADATIASVGFQSPNLIQKLLYVTPSDYKEINPTLSTTPTSDYQDPATFIHYTTENTSASHRHQDVTYVSVRAKFIPHFIGADPITGIATDYNDSELTTENGFYAVFTGDGGSGEDALGARYFETLADARAFVTGDFFVNDIAGHPITASMDPTYDEDAIQGTSDHYIFFYADSWCYYRIYLNVAGNYNILRNTVYIANITGVNYIGTTKADAIPGGYEDRTLSAADVALQLPGTYRGTPIRPGDWFLPAGTPIFPEDVISTTAFATGLSVSISIEDWDINNPGDGYELN